MSQQYFTPGVYIDEVTGPGVIPGVGTSTAAFLGPTLNGPMTPKTITTFDDYQRWFGRAADGWPHFMVGSRPGFIPHAVQGFFDNGGSRAVILRVGTAKAASKPVPNGAVAADTVFVLEAKTPGLAANSYTVDVANESLGGAAPSLAVASAQVDTPNVNVIDKKLPLQSAPAPQEFLVGDVVEMQSGGNWTGRTTVTDISRSNGVTTLVLAGAPPADASNVRIADIGIAQKTFRIITPNPALQPGSLVVINLAAQGQQADNRYALVERTDASGFVEIRSVFEDQAGTAIANPISLWDGAAARTVDVRGFRLTIKDGPNTLDDARWLSLDPFHRGYVFLYAFDSVRILPPQQLPQKRPLSQVNPAATVNALAFQGGADDQPQNVGLNEYVQALKLLEDVDDVNLVCIPDAANDVSVQKAAVLHCKNMKDRIAVLDVPYGRPPADQDSALTHRAQVEADNGFAALYYPWLVVPAPVAPQQPRPVVPQTLAVPPSGHIAGVMARTDQTLGVHEAPANTDVRGVIGLERILSDREQGLINLEGVNALRIFPGEGRVMVWGARTTAPKIQTDWIYVNVRRLLLYIEESIQEGIRWAVFRPNDRPLWQSLKRTLDDFLERVWRDGGLAGVKREQAYQVRIDAGLNPPSEIALGRLHIEIKVAPVRPAEFIIVRIGLWDGGAEVKES